jgi:tRNA-dihydrouridine synthase
VLANGDIFDTEDMARAAAIPGISGVMLASAAQANPIVFAAPRLPLHNRVVADGVHQMVADHIVHWRPPGRSPVPPDLR